MADQRAALTAAGMASAMGGRLVSGDAGAVPAGFGIDSRTLAQGQAFFAIVAVRDGHDFVADAVARGATVVVVSRAVPIAERRVAVIEVADTTRGLQDLARDVRRRSGARVVAITGSAGKTTTKEVTARLLETRFTVAKGLGNLNNHLGLPLSLLELRHGAEVAVMELGMNHAGEIRTLVGIAEPDIRVWTNVGDAHIGHFGSADAIADAKAEVLEQADVRSVFVGNADDARVMARVGAFPGRVVTFGLAEGADVRAVNVEDLGLSGTRATLVTNAGRHRVHVPLVGRGNLSNVLCAAAVATELGVDLVAVSAEIEQMRPARRRGEVVTAGAVTVVDDSYNSSPTALRRALEALSHDTAAARRGAVLGEMLELGELSQSLHEECGRAAAAAGLSWLVTVGGESARALGRAAVAAGMPSGVVRHFASSDAAADAVLRLVTPGDAVLVKGSRGVKTDVVVDRVLAALR